MLLSIALVACHHPTGGSDGTDTTQTPADACDDHPGASLCLDQTAVTCDDAGQVASSLSCEDPDVCSDGACIACSRTVLDVPYADRDRVDADGVHLLVDPAGPSPDRTPYLRPVSVLADGTVSFSGPIQVFVAGGAALSTGDPVHEGDVLLLGATGSGTGQLAIDADACSAALAFDAAPPHDLAGRPLDGFPWFETPNLFTEADDVSVGIDPGTWHDRVGEPFDAYLVPYRDPAAWAQDPTLHDAVAGPVSGTVPDDLQGNALALWSTQPPADLTTPYSVVVDFGRDGRLDPGDLVDGYDSPGLWVSSDLAAPGPYTPTSIDVTSIDYWHSFMLYWPTEIDSISAPIPLVVISHGNGHDYHWYDYLGNHFASHGYAVVVHRNDTADSSIVPAATTTWENTEAFLTRLDTLAGGALNGRIDSHRIAWIGHSRGGEGVVMAYKWLETGQIHPTSYQASDLKMVASIAPTTFNPTTVVDPAHVPVYSLLAGSADGDVTGGVDTSVVEYYRILQNALGLETVTYVHGATHNDFNCCGFADGAGVGPGPKIGRPAAQQIAKAYFLAELAAVFDGHDELWEYFSRPPIRFLPVGVTSPVVTQIKRAPGDRAIVIDDFQTHPEPEVASSGAAVTMSVGRYDEGAMNDANFTLTATENESFNGLTWAESGDANPDRGAVFDWGAGDDDAIEWALASDASDWTSDRFLSFRVAQATRHPYTTDLGGLLSFTVEIEDADGDVSDVDFAVYGSVPPPYARSGLGQGVGWTDEFQTVRIPVQDFAANGTPLDLAHVAALRFRFGQGRGSEEGRIALDDVMLLQGVLP